MSKITSNASWPPRFHEGLRIVLAFGTAFIILTVVSNQVQSFVLAPDASRVLTRLAEIPSFILLGGLALLALRAENVSLGSIGVSRRQARAGGIAVAGIVIVVNLIVIGMALVAGNTLSVGLYAQYVRAFDAGPPLMVFGAITSYLFTGPAEELAFRGYLQNKVISLIGDRSTRIRTGIGILMTALIFAAFHVPNLLIDEGVPIEQAAGGLVLLVFSAILFGVIYELTQNLVLVMLLHGIGNFWPLIVDPGPGVWPNYGVLLLLYAALIVAYRRTEFSGQIG